ncbi:hypothetical protein HHK36_011709 [Tetracentron sinense]|uniref:Uncharacterized protein n=1 Tax=Tetracentron sinense TaxID=13715 RepID=A0A834ZDF7_TETSI|nr:hypothetical protein HHK36_011709 [Tetracentron sinense]
MVSLLVTALFLASLPLFSCLSSDEDSFSFTYNGGKIMTQPVTVSLLWFGDGWQKSGREVIGNAINSLTPTRYSVQDSEVPTLGNWWEIIRQYRDSSNVPVTDRVDVGAECFYTGPHLNMTLDQVIRIGSSVFNQTSIDGLGGNLSCTQVFKISENTIYHVMFSKRVMFTDAPEQRELIDMCSGNFEGVKVFEGKMVKMVWARAPQKADDQCSWIFNGPSYLGPPNRDEKIDSLVGYTLAKIAEEVTNRDGRGWSTSDGNGLSVSSVCPILERRVGATLFMDVERKVSFNVVGLNGYRYMVQHIWDKQIKNCALKLSEPCGTDALTVTQPKGYLSAGITVNHTAGLQPYPPNQKCLWNIHYPTAKFISFTLNYMSIAADSDDHLKICKSDKISIGCSTMEPNNGNFKLVGSKAYVHFTSSDHVSTESRGWELSYSAGLCNGKENVYDHDGVIGYNPPTGFSYVEGLSCQWVLHGKPGTLVSLSFTHINTSKDLDFLTVSNSTGQQMATHLSTFSGLYSEPSLPQINLTGEVVITFSTQTDQGTGWSANFYISSPMDRNEFPLLIIIIVLAGVLLVYSLAFISLTLLMRRKLRNRRNTTEKLELIRVEVQGGDNRIGEGPFAIVYRAVLTDESAVAVKSPRERMFRTVLEEEILLKVSSHPNIITLMGYAQDRTGGRLLVFEFMSMGTLSWNLSERGGTLRWEMRLDIALQISSALQLLHMYMKPPIYHGNLISENILLDESCNAKLGGFGTANYCKNDGLNPDMPSEMAEDILSFGLMLVELLRGETLMNIYASDSSEYLDEVNGLLGGQGCLDSRLEIPEEECKIMGLTKLGEIAKWCISSRQRGGGYETSPKIGDVVLSLKQVKQLFCSVSS